MRHNYIITQDGGFVKEEFLVAGVDIGKFNHVSTVTSGVKGFPKHIKFCNDGYGYQKFLEYLRKHQREFGCTKIIVGLESTGHYWEPLAYWLSQKGIVVVQVNPLHTKRAKELLDNSPLKSDPKDARIITDLVRQGKFLCVVIPKGKVAELRRFVRLRESLITEKTRKINQLHMIVGSIFPEFLYIFKNLQAKTAIYLLRTVPLPCDVISKGIDWLEREIRRVSRGKLGRKRAEKLFEAAQCSVGLQEGLTGFLQHLEYLLDDLVGVLNRIRVLDKMIQGLTLEIPEARCLVSIKGIGFVTAAVMIGETGGFKNYGDAGKILKFAGLNLYEVSSGRHKGRRKITKRGNRMMRKYLYFAALEQARKGMPLHDFYKGLIDRGILRMKALIAVACKIVRLMYSLARDEREYSEEYPTLRRAA